jgi:cyclopropane fatty-acyl-phospholipid synthase-like methyltransferase
MYYFALLYYGIIILGTLLTFAWLGFKLYVMLQGPHFVPCSDDRLQNALALARLKKGERVADLGSGDGKILVACAGKGAICTGYEIDPLLILKSRKRIKKLGLDTHISIKAESFWDADLSKYDVVFFYVVTRTIQRLLPKLKRGLKKNARIVSVYCRLPGIAHQKKKGDVYLYQFPFKKQT